VGSLETSPSEESQTGTGKRDPQGLKPRGCVSVPAPSEEARLQVEGAQCAGNQELRNEGAPHE